MTISTGDIIWWKKRELRRLKTFRVDLFHRQQRRCWYCKRICQWGQDADADDAFTVDHIKPVSHGGRTRKLNLVGSCRACNREKGDLLFEADLLLRVRQCVQELPVGGPVWKPWIDPESPLRPVAVTWPESNVLWLCDFCIAGQS